MLLRDRPDRQTQLVTDGFTRIPRIGRFELCRVSNVLLEFFRRQITSVCVCQRETVFIYIVAVCALYLRDLVTAACYQGHHVDPEDILHTASGDRAPRLLCDGIKTVDMSCRCSPRIDSLLACRDHIDTADCAFFHMIVDIVDKAEQCDDGNVCIAFVEDPVSIIGDDHPCFEAQLCEVTHVLSDYIRIHVYSSHDLHTMFMKISQDVLAHLSASVLNDSDFFHSKPLPRFFDLSLQINL